MHKQGWCKAPSEIGEYAISTQKVKGKSPGNLSARAQKKIRRLADVIHPKWRLSALHNESRPFKQHLNGLLILKKFHVLRSYITTFQLFFQVLQSFYVHAVKRNENRCRKDRTAGPTPPFRDQAVRSVWMEKRPHPPAFLARRQMESQPNSRSSCLHAIPLLPQPFFAFSAQAILLTSLLN